jgi:hypothetical protein
MRQDQYERLQALEEQLLDVFLFEADPTKWPGHGIEPANMGQQTRGDRYWSKRNPAATLVIVTKVQALVHQTQTFGATRDSETPDPAAEEHDQLDKDIAAAEKEAQKLMAELQSGQNKKAFDRKVHGKP